MRLQVYQLQGLKQRLMGNLPEQRRAIAIHMLKQERNRRKKDGLPRMSQTDWEKIVAKARFTSYNVKPKAPNKETEVTTTNEN